MSSKWGRCIALATALCVWGSGSACKSAEPEPEVQLEPEPITPASMHGVHSTELERLMREMGGADAGLLPQEIDTRAEDVHRRTELARLARAIAESAADIGVALDDVELPPEYRAEFVQMSRDLEDRARKLQAAESGPGAADFDAHLSALRATCTACHTKFRILPAARARS